jgi:putative methyltransferase (TIGR04325 family)
MMKAKAIAKDLLPPVMTGMLRSMLASRKDRVRFTGNYPSWEEALRASTGYDAPVILERTRAAMLKVKSGEASYERDSVTFPAVEHPLPLLAGLLRAAAENGGRLNVLDFGGALGSSYFQCRSFLAPVQELRWNVVEQRAQVSCGKLEFSNQELQFHETIDECLAEEKPDVLLMSSVVQYLPEPYAFLSGLLRYDFKYFIIDRTSFVSAGADRLTVQHVPEWIYPGAYPCWFLSESRLTEIIERRYERISTFAALDTTMPEGGSAEYKGFIFRLKST